MTGSDAPGYVLIDDERRIPELIRQSLAQTVVLDIEPLIATWNSSQYLLDQGIARILTKIAALPSVKVVCFATNSARRPSGVPRIPGKQVVYLASARKPLHTEPYLSLPRPGVVVGDQVVTDGVLARRLGYTFLHIRPPIREMPVGPMLFRRCGELLRPLLFR
jgi:predicted HAD superfamily phosphohydrolase YqeG